MPHLSIQFKLILLFAFLLFLPSGCAADECFAGVRSRRRSTRRLLIGKKIIVGPVDLMHCTERKRQQVIAKMPFKRTSYISQQPLQRATARFKQNPLVRQ